MESYQRLLRHLGSSTRGDNQYRRDVSQGSRTGSCGDDRSKVLSTPSSSGSSITAPTLTSTDTPIRNLTERPVANGSDNSIKPSVWAGHPDIPSTTGEARAHIQEIRAEKSKAPPSILADLQCALKVLSEQLYQESTHFLLELVQNSDDNTYRTSIPTMNITYNNRTLRIDCNEIGFSKKNVAALCKIGQSSKSGLDNSRRYIGEKGIGFKSVFKVAHIVWIHSNHYSFRFDKGRDLGMIAPVWADFPAEVIPGVTSMVMKLDPECNTTELIREIQSLDSRLLIFLQNLKRINIQVTEEGNYTWKTSLERHDEVSGSKSYQLVTLRHGKIRHSYSVFSHKVINLPSEKNRVNITQSQILLAFPIQDEQEARVDPQRVYAFLPIRDYGFKFLLQADFFVIASREDIDSSSRWNNALLEQIPHAVHNAIKEFNRDKRMRYSWLPYLPIRPYVGDFFKHLQDYTMDLLAVSPILESFAGELTAPDKLVYVSGRFSDRIGRPLVITKSTTPKYLSHKYHGGYQHRINELRVRNLDTQEFLSDLADYVTNFPEDFQAQSNGWHSRLAEVLLAEAMNKRSYADLVSKLNIVPLQDGQWTSSSICNLAFPSPLKSLIIPKGIGIVAVHPKTEKDYFWQQLLTTLGAKNLLPQQISDMIVQVHEAEGFEPATLEKSTLISHVMFLYEAKWRNADRKDFWFVTKTGGYCRGSQAYMDAEVPYSAASLFGQNRNTLPFIDEAYCQSFTERFKESSKENEQKKEHYDEDENEVKLRKWEVWLLDQMHISIIPRLVTPSLVAPFRLTHEFEKLIETQEPTELLLLLKCHWTRYSRWIRPRDSRRDQAVWNESQQILVSKLSLIKVQCRQGLVRPLKETFLPMSNFQLDISIEIPFLEVPEPEDDLWCFLRYFGVVVEMDANFLVECLRRMKGSPTTLKQISKLYEQISLWKTGDDIPNIRRSFELQRLIFIPPDDHNSDGSWVCTDECVWSGPACLKTTPCLNLLYPENKSFFQHTLGLGEANLKTLVQEARRILSSDTVEHIMQIFVAISKFLDISNSIELVKDLASSRIFPISNENSTDFDQLSTATADDMWFIADRRHLKDSFAGLAPILAFDPDVIEQLGPLITALQLHDRVLSKIATGVSNTDGTVKLDSAYTEALLKKVEYIARLVPAGSSNRDDILKRLRNLKVYQSEKVIVEWVVQRPGCEPYVGRAESGRVALKPRQDELDIFLTEEDINASIPPLELQEALAKFAEVKDQSHFTIILYILMQNDENLIKDILQRRGIPDLPVKKPPGHNDNTDAATTKPDAQKCSQLAKGFRVNIRGRRKCKPEEPTKDLDAFIQRVERVSNLRRNVTEQWGKTDVLHLLSRICLLENQDVASFLPQAAQQSTKTSRGNYKSVLDPKAIWDDASGARMEASKTVAGAQNLQTASATASLVRIPVLVDEETQYIGELMVSTILEKHLGASYNLNTHWTSQLRSRWGYKPYEVLQPGRSTFTIVDDTLILSKLLCHWGFRRASSFDAGIVYNIKVITCKSDLHSEFLLETDQVIKAEECTLSSTTHTPKEMFLLISVYNVLTDPGVALFIDPWQMRLTGSLTLLSSTGYHAFIRQTAVPIMLHELNVGFKKSSQKRIFKSKPSGDAVLHPEAGGSTLESLTEVEKCMYTYIPLRNHREIRLLEIFPGTDQTPLAGSIHQFPVDSAGEYWAISYVWGSALKPFLFHTSDGDIPITLSLHEALHSIRSEQRSIMVWADAICIDQNRSLEKSTQIRLMRTIFESAERVIAWLGEEKDGSHQAIETLFQIRMIDIKPDLWPSTLPAIPLSWGGKNVPSRADSNWTGIGKLLSRAWFQRSWIVQELVLASNVTVICGSWEVDWDDLFRAITICREVVQAEAHLTPEQEDFLRCTDGAYALGLTRQSREKYGHKIFGRKVHFMELLDYFWYTSATRRRDKIFALLGLSSDCNSKVFDPDYESPLSAVTLRYASEFVRQGKAMELLYRAGIAKSYDQCSWIPLWTSEVTQRTISTWAGHGKFCAGGVQQPHARVLQGQPRVLQVRGFQFDTITQVSDTSTENSDIISVVNSIHASVTCLKRYPTLESLVTLKLNLPIGSAKRPHLELSNATPPSKLLADTQPSKKEDWPPGMTNRVAAIGSIQDMIDLLKKPTEEKRIVWDYFQTAAAFARRLSNGSQCVTSKGFMGMVPGQARVGDIICIFSGSAVPFLLRKAGSEDAYQLVGEAYIHGIMYGESLAANRENAREFCII